MKTNHLLVSLNIVLLIAVSILYVVVFKNDRKVAYVDTLSLMKNYKGMQMAREEFQKKATVWQANIDTLTNEVQMAIKDYEKERNGMTKKERELTEELIRTKQQQLINYQQAIQQQSQQEDEKMTGEVLQVVNSYLKNYGEENNYQIILAATQAGNIIYAEDALNITDEVTEGLNKSYEN